MLRTLRFFCFLTVIFGTGCAAVPTTEFKAYTEAVDAVNQESEKFLVDLANSRALISDSDAGTSGNASQNAPSSPFPLNASNPDTKGVSPSAAEARRRALDVVTKYNTTLAELAAGRSPEQVKSGVKSLITSLNTLKTTIGIGAGTLIPFGSQIGNLLGTVIQKLDEANNRQQFIDAMRLGAPIISQIFVIFTQDADDLYAARASASFKNLGAVRDKAIPMVIQMRNVAMTSPAPTGTNEKERFDKVKSELESLAPRIGIKGAVLVSGTTGTYSEIMLSQLEQTLVDVQSQAEKYKSIIDAQQAYYKWIQSYKALIAKANASLAAVVTALDKPVDLNVLAADMVGFVFQVKTDYEAFVAARAE